jgi:hypothetical protein
VMVLQYSHRTFQQVHRLWYGYGDTKLALTPMWLYPSFDLLGHLRVASWNRDILLPALGLLAALVMISRHGFQAAARFLIVVFLGTCVSMSLLMPMNAYRYIFHMVPLAILIAAVALVAGTRLLTKFGDCPLPRRRGWQPIYVRGVAAVTAIAVVAAASGYTLQLTEMTPETSYLPRAADALLYPDYAGSLAYISAHWQPGDVVVTDMPLPTRFFLAEFLGDCPNLRVGENGTVPLGAPDTRQQGSQVFWTESVLRTQSALANREPQTKGRLDQAMNVVNLEDWQQFLAAHPRIWCVCSRILTSINDRSVRSFIRQNMEVKYESFETLVLLSDANHRTASVRSSDEQSLRRSKAALLP